MALARCGGYQPDEVNRAVRRAIRAAGGLDGLVRPGDRVLLKVNLLSPRPPAQAVTTHPAVVAAVARLLVESGARVWVGDSAGGAVSGRSLTAQAFDVSGIADAALGAGARVINHDQAGVVEVANRGPTQDLMPVFPLARPVTEADVIINLPKLKTHSLTVLTGAVKNTLGCVPGLGKMECHRLAPRPGDLARLLVDLYRAVAPAFTVMDAVVAMEGNGPAAGRPRPVGVVIAGRDAVAVDALAAAVVGIPPVSALTTGAAAIMGVGQARLDRIENAGDRLADLRVSGFRLPAGAFLRSLAARLPRSLARRGVDLLRARPRIHGEKCTACGLCRASCPLEAIVSEGGRPRIDPARCVGCLCCHELCPEDAVELRHDYWLTGLVLGGRHGR